MSEEKKVDKKKIAGCVLVLVGIILMLICLFFLAGGKRVFQQSISQEREFEEDQTKKESQTVDHSNEMIAIPGIEKWTVPAGSTLVESPFYNPEKNQCYFVLTVSLKSTGEIIYQSKYLKPGQHLYEVELTRSLEAGEYEAILRYDTYSEADYAPLNGASAPFTLVAK